MVVSIKFMGAQQMVTNTSDIDMPISKQTTAKDALEFVKQRYPDLSLDTGAIFIAVNNEIVTPDKILKATDTINFIPVMGGG